MIFIVKPVIKQKNISYHHLATMSFQNILNMKDTLMLLNYYLNTKTLKSMDSMRMPPLQRIKIALMQLLIASYSPSKTQVEAEAEEMMNLLIN